VDHLVDRGVRCLTVLDISGAALARARQRLGPRQDLVTWIEADVTGEWPVPPVDIWHDRAVFHFLTESADRTAYLTHARAAIRPGGALIIATFALDGPEQCSGLPVMRYSPESLAAEVGTGFELRESIADLHSTPSGATQSFVYTSFLVRA
jgi:SAM-dependent methyltransferase